jgi:hypothetical protein
MFTELKQQLTAFEVRVQGKMVELRSSLRGLRGELSSLDGEVVGPLERVASTVGSARGALSQKLARARADLSALEPSK